MKLKITKTKIDNIRWVQSRADKHLQTESKCSGFAISALGGQEVQGDLSHPNHVRITVGDFLAFLTLSGGALVLCAMQHLLTVGLPCLTQALPEMAVASPQKQFRV